MPKEKLDLRRYASAYECRHLLPELSEWASDDLLRQLTIWKGSRFEKGKMYFDLNNPERGPFVATGEEGFPDDYTYVCRDEVSPEAWAALITWKQPVSPEQAEAIKEMVEEFDEIQEGTERVPSGIRLRQRQLRERQHPEHIHPERTLPPELR